jgi:hypothetical protein
VPQRSQKLAVLFYRTLAATMPLPLEEEHLERGSRVYLGDGSLAPSPAERVVGVLDVDLFEGLQNLLAEGLITEHLAARRVGRQREPREDALYTAGTTFVGHRERGVHAHQQAPAVGAVPLNGSRDLLCQGRERVGDDASPLVQHHEAAGPLARLARPPRQRTT